MKEMFKFQFAVLLLFVLSSCNASYLKEGVPSADPAYGFTPEHPLAINASFEKEAAGKTSEYIKGLRTAEGESLHIVGKSKVANPNYKKPKIILYNWITGEQINQGNGRFLIRYELESESGRDSLQLYVNHFIKGDLLIPHSLFLADNIGSSRQLVQGTE